MTIYNPEEQLPKSSQRESTAEAFDFTKNLRASLLSVLPVWVIHNQSVTGAFWEFTSCFDRLVSNCG